MVSIGCVYMMGYTWHSWTSLVFIHERSRVFTVGGYDRVFPVGELWRVFSVWVHGRERVLTVSGREKVFTVGGHETLGERGWTGVFSVAT